MPTAEMYLSQSAHIAARTLGDDTLIMSTLDSTIFVLNAVGTAIWNAADGRTPLSQIIHERVCSEFEVTDEEAYADAKEFVGQLAEHGILSISHAPVSPCAKPEKAWAQASAAKPARPSGSGGMAGAEAGAD
jgi:Coenzyme PQQ synthesis protein D (PqqD)